MQNLKNKSLDLIKNSTLVRYIMTGGTAYILEMAVLLSLSEVFKLNNTVAISIAFWFGLVISFFMQKILAFQNTNTKPEEISSQGIYYGLLIVFNFIFTLIFTSIFAPIISLIFARTLALIATTFWNYFIYKKIIFNKKFTADNFITSSIKNLIKFNKKYPIIIPAIFLSIFLFTLLVVMSLLASTTSDDYVYFWWIDKTDSPFQYAYEHYLGHNGRISQAFFVATFYSLLKEAAVNIVPIVLTTGLSLSLSWLINLIFKFKKYQKIVSLISGLLVSTAILLSMPSLSDSLLWFTSSTVYVLSLIFLTINICIAITLSRRDRVSPIILYSSLTIMILSQSFSEPTSAVAIGSAGLWMLYELYTKNKKNLFLSIKVLISLVIGFLIVYFSPGTIARRQSQTISTSIKSALIDSLHWFAPSLSGFHLWNIALIVFVAIFISLNLKPIKKISRLYPIITITPIIFLACTYGTFVLSNYSTGWVWLRTMSLSTFGIVISLLLLLITCFTYFISIAKAKNIITTLSILATIILIPGIIGASNMAIVYIKSLSVRNTAINARNNQIKNQLDNKTETITINATPNILEGDAEDIEEPKKTVQWVVDDFKKYYNIPSDKTINITEVPVNYCSNTSIYIKIEYTCK